MLTTLLTVLAPGLAPGLCLSPPAADDGVLNELFEGLPTRWADAVEQGGIPGLAVVAVLDDEVVLLQCFGERDVEQDLPVTPDTPFYIASATKPFVALCLAALADEGKVDLDAPVKRYLPRLRLADEAATESITVRDLLCHRPGINYGPIVLLDAYTGEITEDRYYTLLERAGPTGEVTYSNVHFTIAGRVVEAVTGRPWRDELARRIFEPLGMTATTGYADEMYAREDVAIPTVRTAGGLAPAPVRKTDRTMHAAGGLGTSARDAAQWLRLNIDGGAVDDVRVLSEEACRAMQTLHAGLERSTPFFHDQGFGLGWQVSEFEGIRALKHGGGYVGASSLITFLPEVGLGVAVLCNTDAGGGSLCELVTADVLDRVLVVQRRDLLPTWIEQARGRVAPGGDDAAPEVGLAEDALSLEPEAYVGAYRHALLGTFTVEVDDGRLTARLGDMALELTTLGPDAFHVDSGGMTSDGRFLVEDGAVPAVEVDVMGSGQRFAR